MASEGNKDVPNEALSREQSSISGAKRKRGRPRKYEYPVYGLPQNVQPIQSAPPLYYTQGGSGDSAHGNQSARHRNPANLVKTSDNQTSYHSSAPLQSNLGKDSVLGKHFVGKLTKKIPGFSLITVKVKGDQVLKGWVPDENNLRGITPKDDLAPELPMLRPSQVRKRASAIHMQAAPVPIHLEDVTLAKPLQMRRPVEKTISKNTVPLAPRPYMGSGVIAAVPVSVSPSNTEIRTLAKQDTELVIPQSSVSAVPIKSVRPVLLPCKQVPNQDELVGKMSVNEFHKDSESSHETKESSGERQMLNVQVTDVVRESSGQTQNADTTMTDDINAASGAGDQPNSANSEHQSSKGPSDMTEQCEQLKTETSVLKGVDDSKSGASDDVHPEHGEHEVKIDSK